MTEIPVSVENWLDELTVAQLNDVAHLLQRRAEDKRRGEWQTDETEASKVEQSQPLDVHGDPLP